jgi:pheromone shutdown-related protein TraB
VSELPASVTELKHGDATLFVVGTAHVSQASVDEVRSVIADVKPDCVGVELCPTRLTAIVAGKPLSASDARGLLREGKTLYLVAQLTLAAYQRRIGKRLGVRPGAEMIAAIDAARAANIELSTIDRDIDVTLRRAWSSLSLPKRAMLGASLVFGLARSTPVTSDTVESLKDPKAREELMAELARALPEIKAAVIDERDQYMVSRLRDLVAAGRKRVVAVVGAAHVPGMTAQLDAAIDRARLDTAPPRSLAARAIMRVV